MCSSYKVVIVIIENWVNFYENWFFFGYLCMVGIIGGFLYVYCLICIIILGGRYIIVSFS